MLKTEISMKAFLFWVLSTRIGRWNFSIGLVLEIIKCRLKTEAFNTSLKMFKSDSTE